MTEQVIDVTEFNCETGETVERSFTPEEKTAREALASVIAAERASIEAEKAALDALKASAKAKLVAGTPLTEEEAATIVL